MLTRKLRSAWDYLRRGEFFAFFQAFLTLLPKFFFNEEKFYFYRCEPINATDDTPLEISCGGEADVREIVDSFDSGDETVATLYKTFLVGGAEPWIARENDKLVGVVWFFSQRYLVPWEGYDDAYIFRIDIKPSEAFVGNVFVDTNCRGRGVFAAIVRRYASLHPGTTLLSCITAMNPISQRAHEKIGFRRIGSLITFRLFQFAVGRFQWKTIRRFFRIHRGTEHILVAELEI